MSSSTTAIGGTGSPQALARWEQIHSVAGTSGCLDWPLHSHLWVLDSSIPMKSAATVAGGFLVRWQVTGRQESWVIEFLGCGSGEKSNDSEIAFFTNRSY